MTGIPGLLVINPCYPLFLDVFLSVMCFSLSPKLCDFRFCWYTYFLNFQKTFFHLSVFGLFICYMFSRNSSDAFKNVSRHFICFIFFIKTFTIYFRVSYLLFSSFRFFHEFSPPANIEMFLISCIQFLIFPECFYFCFHLFRTCSNFLAFDIVFSENNFPHRCFSFFKGL